MKKFFYICALAAIAATALSCTKETQVAPVKMKTVSVELGAPRYAETENNLDSKTYLNGTEVWWGSNDKNIVAITDGKKGENWFLFTSDEETAKPTKSFHGDIPEGQTIVLFAFLCNRTSSFGLSKYTGWTTIRNILGNAQGLNMAGSFNSQYNFAVAKPEDLYFRNCHGYLKFTDATGLIKKVKAETVGKEMLMNGSNEEEHREYMAGYFDTTYGEYDDDPTTVKSALNTGSTINARSPYVEGTISSPKVDETASYYLIVLPRTYHGIKLTITLTDGTALAIKSTKEFTVPRGTAVDLGTLPVAALSKAAGSFTLEGSGDFAEGWTLE